MPVLENAHFLIHRDDSKINRDTIDVFISTRRLVSFSNSEKRMLKNK